eukprot:11169528-Lingulodinium_polyedra.AAC.1
MVGNQQHIVRPKSLFNSNREPSEVVDVRCPLRGFDDGVVPDRPKEHVGGVTHADTPKELAEWPKAPANPGGHSPPADESSGDMPNPR